MLTVEDDDDDGKLGQSSVRLCGGGSITAASVVPEQGYLGLVELFITVQWEDEMGRIHWTIQVAAGIEWTIQLVSSRSGGQGQQQPLQSAAGSLGDESMVMG